MIYHCEFDPARDLCKTVPDMSVDLAGAIETGVVLDTGTVTEHNDIDSPASILGRVRDCFDAFEAKKAILNAGRIKQESSSAPAQSSAQASVQPSAQASGFTSTDTSV